MPANPKITIITATYNAEVFLEQTIQSVLTQTYSNIEYIVIDGGSTDGTVDIIKKYEADLAYWVSEQDQGIYDAWNKGVRAATGEWIAFLGADDILLPHAIERLIQKAADIPLDFVSARVEFVENDLRHVLFYGRAWKWSTHKHQMKVSHVGALHHRSLFDKYGLYDTNYKIAGDYEFLLRPKDSLKTLFVPEVIGKMRVTGVSKTNNKVFQEALRAKRDTAGLHPLRCYIDYYYQITKNKLVGDLRRFLNRQKAAHESK